MHTFPFYSTVKNRARNIISSSLSKLLFSRESSRIVYNQSNQKRKNRLFFQDQNYREKENNQNYLAVNLKIVYQSFDSFLACFYSLGSVATSERLISFVTFAFVLFTYMSTAIISFNLSSPILAMHLA